MKHVLFLLLFAAQLSAQVAGLVKGVHDGDTYWIEVRNERWVPGPDTGFIKEVKVVRELVRIEGVGTPELYWPGVITKAQPLGREVGDSVRWMIKGKPVSLDTFGRDQYGRLLCRIRLEDGRDLAEIILSKGWGWYSKNDLDKPTRRRYQHIRNKAKNKKLGVHLAGGPDDNEWRKTHKPGR